MAYANKDDVLLRIDETQLDNLTVQNDTLLNSILDLAALEMDSKLSKYYNLPFEIAIPTLTSFNVEMAICLLYKRRAFTDGSSDYSGSRTKYCNELKDNFNALLGNSLVATDGSIIEPKLNKDVVIIENIDMEYKDKYFGVDDANE